MINPDEYLNSEGRKGYLQSELRDYIFEKHKEEYGLICCNISRPKDYVSPAIINWIIGEHYEGKIPTIMFVFEDMENIPKLMWIIIGSYIVELKHIKYNKEYDIYKMVHSYRATDTLKVLLKISNSELTLKTVNTEMLKNQEFFELVR